MAFKGFFGAFAGLVKKYWLPMFVVFFVVAVFLSGLVFIPIYRALRGGVEKVAPSLAANLPVK